MTATTLRSPALSAAAADIEVAAAIEAEADVAAANDEDVEAAAAAAAAASSIVLDWAAKSPKPKLGESRRAKSLEGKMGLMCNPTRMNHACRPVSRN